jgi:hypothetical protein
MDHDFSHTSQPQFEGKNRPLSPERYLLTELPRAYEEIRNAISSLVTTQMDLEYLGEDRQRVLSGISRALDQLREARDIYFEATIVSTLM